MLNKIAARTFAFLAISILTLPVQACSSHSPSSEYDGTYRGTFYYDYQTVTWDSDKELPGGAITSPWKPTTIGVEVTFKKDSVSASAGWVTLEITHVACDDPVFGTGLNGVSPDDNNGSNAYALLPVPPDRTLKSSEGIKLVINFPNGSSLITDQTPSNRGEFTASSDGKSLSYSFVFIGSEDYGTGAFSAFAATGPFSPMKEYPEYYVRAKSWTLNKVA